MRIPTMGTVQLSDKNRLFGGPYTGGQNVWRFSPPLANSQPVHLPVDSHRLFRTVACSSRSDCTRCVVFFSLPSLSEYPGRLATHGWNFVWHALCDGGMHTRCLDSAAAVSPSVGLAPSGVHVPCCKPKMTTSDTIVPHV